MGRGRKNSFVGTAEYVCPELLKGNSAGFSADLWSLGCVLFTLLSGKFPFRGASEYLTFQKILNREFEFPENFPEVARDLVNALLQMNPEDRLGAGAGGFADLKQHEFFKGIDFAHIHEQLAPAFEDILSSNSEERRLQSTVIATDLEAEVLEIKEVNKSSNLFSSRGDEWQAFLLPNEEIVKSGFVTKRRGLFSKTRMLILTNQPRFVYIDASKMEKRGEISWSSSLYAELKNERTFYVHTPKRSYYFQSLDSTARFWVEQVSKIMKNREKHVS